MERNIDHCLDLIGVSEGGYVNRKTDKGGPTNMGITLKTLRATVMPNATVADLKNLSPAQARMVYKRNYADPIHFAELPDGLDYSMLDESILSGPDRAIRRLQSVLNTLPTTLVPLVVDGKLGAKTTAAMHAANLQQLITAYNDDRLLWLKSIPGPQGFEGNPGWETRVKRVKAESLNLSKLPTGAVTVEKVVEKPVVPTAAPKMMTTKLGAIAVGVGTVASGAHDFLTGLDPKVQIVALALIAVGAIAIYIERRNIAQAAKEIING